MTEKPNKEHKNDIWLLILSWAVLIVIIIALASSCSPRKQLARLEYKHPELLLRYCDIKAITDTVVIPGGIQVDTQTITLDCDTVTTTDTFSWQVVKRIPVKVHVPDTIVVNMVDTSGKALLHSDNSRLTDENNTLQGRLSTWQFWAILGYVLAIVLAVIIGLFVRIK